MGLGYQWNFDFARPSSLTICYNQYALVMIEHFPSGLKWFHSRTKVMRGLLMHFWCFTFLIFSKFGVLA